ncbi:MAG: DUF1499 domain-containing protein [Lentisphaeria bacterium]|nr:DUF1499 domain-containing protein [Lentisphaeria bacterium]
MGLFTGIRPTNLGIKNNCLADCPSTPNCVSSQGQGDYYIEPYALNDCDAEWEKLKTVLVSYPRSSIIKSTENYIYMESTSRLLRYVDDVEFYLDPDAKLIHVRSASRIGRTDFGVNRNRIEDIRSLLYK